MKRKAIFIGVLAAVVGSLVFFQIRSNNAQDSSAQQGQVGPKKLADFMQMKLEYSKEILAGLALEDYERIAKNSQALSLMSLESGWNVLNTQDYLDQSRDFRSTSKVIQEAAKEKNIERATLGYVSMTVRCVECHSYLRKRDN